MPSRRKAAELPNKPLDSLDAKRARGRPSTIPISWVVGRARNYRFIFDQVWDQLWPLLSKAQNEADVAETFQQAARTYAGEFVPSMVGLVLRVLGERRFPKRRSAQINFLADSLGGVGSVTPRRSRDICAEWTAKEKRAQQAHHIIRYEFWIECSCGFKGRSQDHACARCGAKMNLGSISALSPFLAGIDTTK